MLLLILIPLIDVTFSTPTGVYTHWQLLVPSSASSSSRKHQKFAKTTRSRGYPTPDQY
jgi:hypothetical protein